MKNVYLANRNLTHRMKLELELDRPTAGNPRTLIKSQLGYSCSCRRQHFPQQLKTVNVRRYR